MDSIEKLQVHSLYNINIGIRRHSCESQVTTAVISWTNDPSIKYCKITTS